MTMTSRLRWFIALVLAACSASADTVVTQDGQTLKGRVVSEDAKAIVLRSRFGDLTIPKGEVKEHQRGRYVLQLKDGSKLIGQIVGETKEQLSLKVGEETKGIALADVKQVVERTLPDAKKLDEMREKALKFLTDKKYAKALELYDTILEAAPDDATSHYNVACAYALTKRNAEAVVALRRALETGFVRFGHLEADPDLDGLRGDAAFQQLMKERDKYVANGVARSIERVRKALAARGIDHKPYRTVTDPGRNFTYLHARSDEDLAAVRATLEQYGEWQWKHLLQNRPQDPLYIVLLNPADTRKIFGNRAGGAFSANSNVLLCGDIPAWKLVRTSVIMHEFTHALHYADMAARRQKHPIWMIEGLATLFETVKRENGDFKPVHSQRLAVLQAVVRSKRHIAWAQMMKLNHAAFMRTAPVAYAQARYMLLYMFEKGLLKRFYDAYTENESYADDKSALRTVEVVFGKPIAEVEHDWRQWVLAQKVPGVPFLGVRTKQEGERLVVVEVTAKSPADKAGVKVGDALASLDGEPLAKMDDLLAALGQREVGEEVPVQVKREGTTVDLKLKLGARPPARRPRPPKPAPKAFLGASVEEAEGKVRVKAITKDSPAAKAGLEAGDTVVELDGKPVTSVRQFLDAVTAAKPGQTMKVAIQRGDERQTLDIKLTALK
jgi:RNase P/RNase MRP subunit p29